MVGGGGRCGLGDDRAVINNRLHQTLCNLAFDLKKKKKKCRLGRRRKRSFNFSPTAEQPVHDLLISQHKLVELFDYPYIVFESKVYRKRNIKESLEGKVS